MIIPTIDPLRSHISGLVDLVPGTWYRRSYEHPIIRMIDRFSLRRTYDTWYRIQVPGRSYLVVKRLIGTNISTYLVPYDRSIVRTIDL